MKHPFSIVLTLALAGPAVAGDDPARTRPLRVLYVGNTDTDRGLSYATFLAQKFDLVGTHDRNSFDPRHMPDADVVLLDWSQSDVHDLGARTGKPSGPESDLKSPLGERSQWTRPTVLLGSAGHLLAAPWKVFGGSG